MLYFKREMRSMAGKIYKAGSVVPDEFSNPNGLAEMILRGDIVDVIFASEKKIEDPKITITLDDKVVEEFTPVIEKPKRGKAEK